MRARFGAGLAGVGRASHLPAHVVELLLPELGVQVVNKEAQMVQRGHARRQLTPSNAREQLLDGIPHHTAICGVDIELR